MTDNQYIILGGGYKSTVCFCNTGSSLPYKFSLSLTLINIFHTSVSILNSWSLMTWERLSIAIWRSCFKEIKLNFIIICI